jgi:Rieske 2Fe-2S family protein
VRNDAVEDAEYDCTRLMEVWDATNQQDLALLEGAFRGVKSRRFAPGPIHASREPAIHNALTVHKRLMAS